VTVIVVVLGVAVAEEIAALQTLEVLVPQIKVQMVALVLLVVQIHEVLGVVVLVLLVITQHKVEILEAEVGVLLTYFAQARTNLVLGVVVVVVLQQVLVAGQVVAAAVLVRTLLVKQQLQTLEAVAVVVGMVLTQERRAGRAALVS
jgi:hypothetical protein